MTTYADQLLSDPYCAIAIEIGHSNKMPAEWMHKAARYLSAFDSIRKTSKGKNLSKDHMKQMLVKWIRQGRFDEPIIEEESTPE